MEIKKVWKYHLLLAIVIILMDYFRDYVYKGESGLMSNFDEVGIVYKITFYLTFYSVYIINYKVICPYTLSKKKLSVFILGMLLTFLIFPTIRFLLEEIIVFRISGFHNYSDHTRVFGYYIFDNSYYNLKALLFSTFMYLLFMYIKNKNKIHGLEIEHKKAEMALLKTQLEPHFLFNTLNTFYTELVDTQPSTAKSIHKLSELLRYVTYEAQKDFMPIAKELKFIEDYIYLHQKRFEDSLHVNFSVEGNIKNQQIPSLIMIHFIENIFKHGLLNDPKNPAIIRIDISTEHLTLTTSNKIARGQTYSRSGIGRENLKKRLQLIFNSNFEYKFKEEDQQFQTYLTLPLTQSKDEKN